MSKSITRIAVIYDGNYFRIVSNYYHYNHPRQSYLSIGGLHEFVRQRAAELEEVEIRHCQIVDAHYFRGRLWAQEVSQHANRLYRERVMDDILMAEGVTQHNLPLKNINGRKGEKGIDVWLALETYELAVLKKFDVIALFASDGDYVPLVRKLNTLGIRVMLLGWDFETMNDEGFRYVTKYSRDLAWECSYPIEMHPEIEQGLKNKDQRFLDLFPREDRNMSPEFYNEEKRVFKPKPAERERTDTFDISTIDPAEIKTSTILRLFNGFGFIEQPPNNVFFHYSQLVNTDFNALSPGDVVQFSINHENSTEERRVATFVMLADGQSELTENFVEKNDETTV
jgi:uncharacterized LabA/DUF88 family protein/cold shock CspA family protein